MRSLALALVSLLLPLTSLTACGHGSPPTPSGVDATVAPLPGPATTAPSASMGTASSEPRDAGGTAIADAGPIAIVDAGDPGAQPQTHDRPAATSDALTARARTLWDAIAHDDPERALPFFFPVTAYEQVKAIAFPASDWRRRLVSAYARDVHALAKRLGSGVSSATFVRLEIPDERARWVEPNEESNKLGYFRVYGTRLVYAVDGHERAFDVSSLISWRGEWYCVHLTGFK